MKPTYVYFLVGNGEHSGYFKIGISINPFVRQGSLGQEIDLDRSVCVGYAAEEARENEKWLHGHFADFRMCRSAIGEGNGCTEWFSMECFADAVEILEANPGTTGVIKVEQKTMRLNVEIREDLYLSLKLQAIKERKSISEIVLKLMQGYVSVDQPDQRGKTR